MGRQLFGTGLVRRNAAPRRALESSTPVRPGRSEKPFSQAIGDRSRWVSHTLATVAVGALGVMLAGSLSISGQATTGSGTATGRTAADLPDTSKAIPAQAAGRAGADSPGRDGRTDTEDDRGTLDSFDRRQESTSRDTVRKKLEQAGVTNRAQERRNQLNSSQQEAAKNNRGLSAKERSKDLEKTREQAKAEAERQAEEERRKAEEKRRKAEEARRRKAVAGGGGIPVPDPSTLPKGNGAVAPLPAGSYVIGARWGEWGSWSRYHTGQDLAAPHGTPIVAAKSGVVVPGTGGWAGINVAIRHSGGGATLYAHMSRRVAQVGQTVRAGQIIGYVGSTGRSTGPHLHFEYYPAGSTVGSVYTTSDPIAWLRANGGHV